MSNKSSIVSGMGLGFQIMVSLMKLVVEIGGKEEYFHRLATQEGESLLKKLATLIVEDASGKKLPMNGDKAYTEYHGRRFVGVLSSLTPVNERHGGRCTGYIVPEDPREDWRYHGFKENMRAFLDDPQRFMVGINPMDWRGLTVGYDEDIRWDEELGMWYAPADYD